MPDPTNLVYTTHALERMAQYGISREDVEDVVALPEVMHPDAPTPDANLACIGGASGKVVKVILAYPRWDRVITVVWPDHDRYRGARA